jgi:hypothetical protein
VIKNDVAYFFSKYKKRQKVKTRFLPDYLGVVADARAVRPCDPCGWVVGFHFAFIPKKGELRLPFFAD